MKENARMPPPLLCLLFLVLIVPPPALCNADDRTAVNEPLPFSRSVSDRVRGGLPLTLFSSEHFVGAGRCANCHDLLRDAAGNDMSIANHWRSTMMANAAKDPFWQAKVASETERHPEIKNAIEKKCATCHMPMAYVTSQNNGYQPAISGSGFLEPANGLHHLAMDGVSCSLCHQIAAYGLGSKESFSGKFRIDTTLMSPEKIIYGPYRNPLQESMRNSVGFTPRYGTQVNSSELCSSCHTLYTNYLDSKGEIAGEFPEQTPYLEWRHSIYARSPQRDIGEKDTDNPAARICQECHMPHSQDGPVMIARYAPPEATPKEHFSQHHFVGGNTLMLDVLQENSPLLGVTASSRHLEATKARTLSQLQNDTASLVIDEAQRSPEGLTVRLTVRNKAGHKFPTGFPSRRAWLYLRISSEKGETLFESGRPMADGSIAGNDNDTDPSSFEPHYQNIFSGDQIQIYETIMCNTDKEITYTLMRAAGYLKDNRLLPAGFDKDKADRDIAVYGMAAGDADFIGGSDTTTYTISLPNGEDGLTIEAALFYSPLSQAFQQDLLLDDQHQKVKRFERMLRKVDRLPVAVAYQSKTI